MTVKNKKKQLESGSNRLRKAPGRGTSTAGEERGVGLINHACMSLCVKEKDDVSFLMNSTLLLIFFDQAASSIYF